MSKRRDNAITPDELYAIIYAACGKEAPETVANVQHALWYAQRQREEAECRKAK
jgi:hypothetical protein